MLSKTATSAASAARSFSTQRRLIKPSDQLTHRYQNTVPLVCLGGKEWTTDDVEDALRRHRNNCLHDVEEGMSEGVGELKAVLTEVCKKQNEAYNVGDGSSDAGMRVKAIRKPFKLNYTIPSIVSLVLYSGFLPTLPGDRRAKLLSRQEIGWEVTDEEYLMGVMKFCNFYLSHLSLTLALSSDLSSLNKVLDLTNKVFGQLSKFDLRNGDLRREFDGVKWTVRKVEGFVYDICVKGGGGKKRKRCEDEDGGKDAGNGGEEDEECWSGMLARYATYDKNREAVIKSTRTIQKSAKNSIHSLHRGDYGKADELLEACKEQGISIIKDYIDADPSLRLGSFTSAIEEYVEGYIFYHWLKTSDLLPYESVEDDAKWAGVTEAEYLGGLADATGEIGRVAVIKGTKLDVSAVQTCMDSIKRVLMVFEGEMLPGGDRGVGKKGDMVRKNYDKVRNIYYELGLKKGAE